MRKLLLSNWLSLLIPKSRNAFNINHQKMFLKYLSCYPHQRRFLQQPKDGVLRNCFPLVIQPLVYYLKDKMNNNWRKKFFWQNLTKILFDLMNGQFWIQRKAWKLLQRGLIVQTTLIVIDCPTIFIFCTCDFLFLQHDAEFFCCQYQN